MSIQYDFEYIQLCKLTRSCIAETLRVTDTIDKICLKTLVGLMDNRQQQATGARIALWKA